MRGLMGEVRGAVHLHRTCLFLTPHGSSLMGAGGGEHGSIRGKNNNKTLPHSPEGPLGLWSCMDAGDEGRHRKWGRPKGRKENKNPCRSRARLEGPPPAPQWHCRPWLAPGSGGNTDNSGAGILKRRARGA